MDEESYEQIALPETTMSEPLKWVKPNETVDMLYIDGEPADIQLSASVELEVTHTEPGVRGDTASGGGNKPATLETGATVNVPLFVNIGDRGVVRPAQVREAHGAGIVRRDVVGAGEVELVVAGGVLDEVRADRRRVCEQRAVARLGDGLDGADLARQEARERGLGEVVGPADLASLALGRGLLGLGGGRSGEQQAGGDGDQKGAHLLLFGQTPGN
jgi:hypothetical protein